MIKRFLFLCAILVTLTTCERDDICIDETTPDLIIKFLDATDTENTKSVNNLKIKIIDTEIDTIISSGDSIFIPIRIDSDVTRLSLTNQIDLLDIRTDTLTLNYDREETFVGRACGFKLTFNSLSIQSTNNWIQNSNTVNEPQNIENEAAAHITISH